MGREGVRFSNRGIAAGLWGEEAELDAAPSHDESDDQH